MGSPEKVAGAARLSQDRPRSSGALPREHHLRVAQGALAEARLAIGEVELPKPDEGVGIAERAHRGGIGQEALAPVRERRRIVRADVLEVDDTQVARRGHRTAQGRYGRNGATGEDV